MEARGSPATIDDFVAGAALGAPPACFTWQAQRLEQDCRVKHEVGNSQWKFQTFGGRMDVPFMATLARR